MSQNSSLISALEILKNHSFLLGDLPTDVASAVWHLLQIQLGLSIGQLSALQNYVVENQNTLKSPPAKAPSAKATNAKKPTATKKRKGHQQDFYNSEDVIVIQSTDDSCMSEETLPLPSAYSPPQPAFSLMSKKLFDNHATGGFNSIKSYTNLIISNSI